MTTNLEEILKRNFLSHTCHQVRNVCNIFTKSNVIDRFNLRTCGDTIIKQIDLYSNEA